MANMSAIICTTAYTIWLVAIVSIASSYADSSILVINKIRHPLDAFPVANVLGKYLLILVKIINSPS